MNKAFRKLALLCAISVGVTGMAFGSVSVAEESAATEQTEQKTVLSGEEYATLTGLGMTSSKATFYEGEKITRADFSYILARLGGYTEGYKPVRSFSDIPLDAYYYDAVGFLADTGVVNGAGGGAFEPNSELTYDQAAKMAVYVLGYSVVASEKYGAYPIGERRMAMELDLLVGMQDGSGEDTMSTRDAFVFLDAVARADVADPYSFGQKETGITVKEGTTLLTINYGIDLDKGIMTDNGITALSGVSTCKENGAEINGRRFEKVNDGLDYKDFIGEFVEFWYDEEDSRLIYLHSLQEDDEVLRLSYDELNIDSPNFTITNIVYNDDNGKEKNAKVLLKANLIYNGASDPYWTVSDLKILSGNLTLVDSDFDGVYDIVKVREYEDCKVNFVDISGEKIYTDTTNVILSDWNNVTLTNLQGAAIELSDIAAGSPVSLLKTKDETALTVIDCSEYLVKGAVQSIREGDYGKKIFKVDGKDYTASLSYQAGMINSVKTGESYTFYRNADGEIFKIKELDGEDWTSVYCVGFASEGSFSKTLKARVVLPDGSVTEYLFPNKFSVDYADGNGLQKSQKAEDVLSSPSFVNSNGSYVRQPLMFKLDQWGEVSAIKAPRDNTASAYKIDLDNFSKDFTSNSVIYKGENVKAVNGGYFLGNNSTIYVDPYLTEGGTPSDVKDIEAVKVADMSSVTGLSGCTIYDLDEKMNIGTMVLTELGGAGQTGDDSWESALFLVDEIFTRISEKDETEEEKVLTGTMCGAAVEYTIEDEDVVQKLKDLNIGTGCICTVKLDSRKNIDDIQLLYDLNQEPTRMEYQAYRDVKFSYLFGPVYSLSDRGIVTIMPEGSASPVFGTAYNGASAPVAVYDKKRKTVRVGSTKDLYTDLVPASDGSVTMTDETPWVFILKRYCYARDVVFVIE